MSISHNFADESLDKKSEWFKSLTMEQRMDIFSDFEELVLSLNPIAGRKIYDWPASKRIQVLALA